ncbi:MAG: flagellar filament capping protein FliD [Proteobacteria bacterium]|nr:flagellar filament capping protein FliD [Pseudomonadota bacterium]
MGISSSVGLISGLDTEAIITAIMNVERIPISRLQQKQAASQAKISSYGQIKSTLSTLQSSISSLKTATTFAPGFNATSTNKDFLAVSVSNGDIASAGTYKIKVNQLATSAQMTSNTYTDSGETVGTGTLHFQVGDGEKQSVVIDMDNQSLEDIAKAINDANTDVSASVLRVTDNDYRLSLTAKDTGKDLSYTYQETGFTFETTSQASTTSGEVLKSQNVDSDVTALGLTGTLSINGTDIVLGGTETLNDIQTSIDAIAGITATVNYDSTTGTYSLGVENDAAQGRVDLTYSDSDSGAGLSNMMDTGATIAATKALLNINNIDVERDGNTIDDLISGLTLNLTGEDPTETITVSVAANFNDSKTKIDSFVESFNNVISTLDSLQSYSSDSGTAGNLLGDSTANSLRSGLRRMIFSSINGISSSVNSLSRLGIEVEESGKLSFNSSTFTTAMQDNTEDVTSFFTNDTSSSQGFAVQFNTYMNGYLDSRGGILTAKIDGYTTSSSKMDDSIASIETRLSKREDNLRKQYANLEQLLSSFTSTSSYLSGQLSSLTNMTNSFYKN